MSRQTDGKEPAGAGAADAAILDLVRAIRRDIAHDLRGPVQSVVVSTEVARRGLAAGDSGTALERLEVIEADVRRLHDVADAVLDLVRPLPVEPRVFDVGTVLAAVDGILHVLARAARTVYHGPPNQATPLVRSIPESLTLCLVRTAVAVNATCGLQGEMRIATRAASDAVEILFTGRAADGDMVPPGPDIEHAASAARLWLQPGNGTVEVLPGSDPMAPVLLRIRLPRADMA